jgi:hypothetical protein
VTEGPKTIVPPPGIAVTLSAAALGPVEAFAREVELVEHVWPLQRAHDPVLARPRGGKGKTLRARAPKPGARGQ